VGWPLRRRFLRWGFWRDITPLWIRPCASASRSRCQRPPGRLGSVGLLPIHKSAGCPIVRFFAADHIYSRKGEWLCSKPTQSRISGNRFMTTSEDNILNGFCQTANPQCATSTRCGSWMNFPNWVSGSQTTRPRRGQISTFDIRLASCDKAWLGLCESSFD